MGKREADEEEGAVVVGRDGGESSVTSNERGEGLDRAGTGEHSAQVVEGGDDVGWFHPGAVVG
jgi:hypothetical protein